MQSNYIDTDILQLAQDFDFKITKNFIFKQFCGTIVTISANAQVCTKISINQYALSDFNRIEQTRKLESFSKDNKLNIEIKSEGTQTTILLVQRTKIDIVKQYVQQILSILEQSKNSQILELSEFEGQLVFKSQLSDLENENLKVTQDLSQRLRKSIALTVGVSSILFLLTQRFPQIIQFTTSPMMPFFLILPMSLVFFRGFNRKLESVFTNLLIFNIFFISTVAVLLYVSAMAVIPSQFNKSFELVRLTLLENNSATTSAQLLATLLYCIFLSFNIFAKYKPNILVMFSIDEFKKLLTARKKLSFLFAGFLVFGALAIVASIVFSETYEADTDVIYQTPTLILTHFIFSLLFYYFARRMNENRSISDVEYFISSLIAPSLITVGLFFMIPNISFRFSDYPTESKQGFVSQFRNPEITRAFCYHIIDKDSGLKLPMNACERHDEFLKAGTLVNYQVKSGYFGNKIYFKPTFIHSPTTTALLFENSGKLSKVRSSDFKYILRDEIEKNKLFGEYFVQWQTECANGKADFCRFASYLAEEQKKTKEADSLRSKGCELNDYISCYGIRYKEKDKTESSIIKKHESLVIQHCNNNDIDACLQYLWFWKDDKTQRHRHEYIDVLKKLCAANDQLSCQNLVWEKYRI